MKKIFLLPTVILAAKFSTVNAQTEMDSTEVIPIDISREMDRFYTAGQFYIYRDTLYSYETTPVNPMSCRVISTNRSQHRTYLIDKDRIYPTEFGSKDMNLKKTGVLVNSLGERSLYLCDGKKLMTEYRIIDNIDFGSLRMLAPNMLIDKNNLYIHSQVVPLSEMFLPFEVIDPRSVSIDRGERPKAIAW